MTGAEYKAIRTANNVRQNEIGTIVKTTWHTVSKYERSEYVPIKLVDALSSIIKIDLTKQKNVDELLSKIPDRYKHKRLRNNTYFSQVQYAEGLKR